MLLPSVLVGVPRGAMVRDAWKTILLQIKELWDFKICFYSISPQKHDLIKLPMKHERLILK